MEQNTPIALGDYAKDFDSVVLFWASVGSPMGQTTVLGYDDIDFAERNDLLGLIGAATSDGDWAWNGEGNPTDDQNNTITKVQAYVDDDAWTAIVEEYENEG